MKPPTAEHERLADSLARRADWKNWGPYVAERAWGTVREDYSASGDAVSTAGLHRIVEGRDKFDKRRRQPFRWTDS